MHEIKKFKCYFVDKSWSLYHTLKIIGNNIFQYYIYSEEYIRNCTMIYLVKETVMY